jgi:hypothetical protein
MDEIMDDTQLDSRFSFHQVESSVGESINQFRAACRDFADTINTYVPEGREKSLAMTHMEEVMFWAIAGIARG